MDNKKPNISAFQGLIIAYCPECGEYTTFFSREVAKKFTCHKCHKTSIFEEEPKPLVSKCECGNYINAVTNSNQKSFEFSCKCGYPNCVEYSDRKHKYFGMR